MFFIPSYFELVRCWAICTLLLSSAGVSLAIEVDGFTEPYRDIDIAASEVGLLKSIEVTEGDRVKSGQLLARLDDTVLQATLTISKSVMEAQGQLKSAAAELKFQSEVVDKLHELRDRHHASQQEVERAESQLRIAAARLMAVREEKQIKGLEYERARLQIEQRHLTSPIDGIVTRIFKDPGEFVSLNDPVVIKVVQLDPLLVVFSVPAEKSRAISVGQTVDVRIAEAESLVQGKVDFVSPTADPQSGTARVRVCIPNPQELLPSGATCRLVLGDLPTPLAGVGGR